MEIQIILRTGNIDLVELKKLLEEKTSGKEIALEIRRPAAIFRAPESSILLAIVATSGTALGALVSGILQIIKERSAKRIVIQSKSGTRLEVPRDIKSDELEVLVSKIRELESDSPQVLLD